MIIPPGFIGCRLPIRHSTVTRPAMITFGVDNNSGLTDPVLLADAISNCFNGALEMAAVIDNGCTCGPLEVAIGQDGGDPILGVASFSFPGLRAASSVTPNVALLVRKRTALGGRKNRGRFFIPWSVREDQVDEGGIIAAADVTTAQNAVTTTLSTLQTANLPMVILHQADSAVPPLVTSLTVDALVATQRRRLGR